MKRTLYTICFLLFPLIVFATEVQHSTPKIITTECNNTLKQLEHIHFLSTHGKLKNALLLVKKLHKKCHRNQNILYTYSKLLFWNNQLETAYHYAKHLDLNQETNSNLYLKISEAYHIKQLENSLNQPKKIFKILSALSTKESLSYSIRLLKIQALIREGSLKKATVEAENFTQSFPKENEPKLMLAKLYFWTKKYTQSLSIYQKLYTKEPQKLYKDEIEKIKEIQCNLYLLKTNKKIKKFLQKNQRDNAWHLYTSLKEKKEKFIEQYPYTNCKIHSTHMLGMGTEHYHRNNASYTDETNYIEATLPIANYTLYSRLEKVKRYHLEDTKISGELYPVLPNSYWGYISFSKTFGATFLSDYSLGLHLFKETGKWQWGTGIVLDKYDTERFYTLIGEYSYYLNDFLVWRQALNYLPKYRNYALLNQLHYETPCHTDYKITYTYGSANNLLEDENSFIAQKTHTVEFSFEYPLAKRYTLGGGLSLQHNKNSHASSFQKKGFTLFIRKYW
ncbi:hypothetical protein MNB_SV-3-1585 [hydrothermal vent metagenome]|uniref:Uncharacterized protein n=1 Tax=hydrothermal vent metagenome TaxID=652676 RepID=A0A1W1CA04_9ZZZZ